MSRVLRNEMMTPALGPKGGSLFSIVDARDGGSCQQGASAPSRKRLARPLPTRNKQAGQAIVEFALTFSLFLILLLGGIDLAWDVNQKSNFDYVVTQAATCVATVNCVPATLGAQTASGLGLNPANLNLTVNGLTVSATYQGVSLTHFLPAITFNATVTATCLGCL